MTNFTINDRALKKNDQNIKIENIFIDNKTILINHFKYVLKKDTDMIKVQFFNKTRSTVIVLKIVEFI